MEEMRWRNESFVLIMEVPNLTDQKMVKFLDVKKNPVKRIFTVPGIIFENSTVFVYAPGCAPVIKLRKKELDPPVSKS